MPCFNFQKKMILVTPKMTTWSCKSESWKKIIVGMQNGNTEPTSTPKAAHASDPLFLDFKIPNFREALTRERFKAGSFLSSRKWRSCLSMLSRAQPLLQDFDLEATAATAVVTLAKNGDVEDARSVMNLFNLTASFTYSIKHPQQRHVIVSLLCPI